MLVPTYHKTFMNSKTQVGKIIFDKNKIKMWHFSLILISRVNWTRSKNTDTNKWSVSYQSSADKCFSIEKSLKSYGMLLKNLSFTLSNHLMIRIRFEAWACFWMGWENPKRQLKTIKLQWHNCCLTVLCSLLLKL